MKKSFVIILILFSNYCVAQKPECIDIDFKFCEFLNDSIIKAYYNEIGVTSCKECSYFYRIAQLSKHYLMFIGEVKDYYLDSILYFECPIDNTGFYHGESVFYYPNGKIKIKGFYKQGLRDSIWTYYYPDGNLKKVMQFSQNQARLLEFYNKRGKQVVINGNGECRDNLMIGNKSDYETTLAGHIKNGKLDGKWTFSNSYYGTIDGAEYYEDGVFIKGESKGLMGDATYYEKPRATFFEYIPQESVDVYAFSLSCPGFSTINPGYKGFNFLNGEFYPELLEKITNQVSIKEIANQWFMVAFNINSQKQLNNLHIKSSIGNMELLQKIGEIITSMKGWTEAGVLNGKTINYPFYFVLAFENGNLIIPGYHF